MNDILIRVTYLISIIALGYLLKKIGTFPDSTVNVLSKIILRITLPATIVCSYAGKSFDTSLLIVPLIGFAANMIYVIIMLLIGKGQDPNNAAFDIVNTPGYNIGIFALPLLQSMFGASSAVVASLFDTGSSIISLGGSYSIALVIKNNDAFSFKKICLNLAKSVPLITCIVMLILSLSNIVLPHMFLEFADILSDANVFLGMFMIGVAFRFEVQKTNLDRIIKILSVRYLVALIIALICWYILPFDTIIKQIVVMLLFSPTAASSVAWTGELNGDTGTASAIGSISILCSITVMILLLASYNI